MRIWLLVLACFGCTTAVPLANKKLEVIQELLSKDELGRNTALEQLILNALEDLRAVMVTGSDIIPVMDPLHLPSIHLDGEDFEIPESQISLQSTRVEQLSTFVVDSLNLNLVNILFQRYNLVFNGHLPTLDVHSESYDLSLRALGLNVFGKGEARLKIVEPRVSGTIAIRILVFSGSIVVESANIKFALGGFEPEIQGLFGNEGASAFANTFLKNLLPELVELYENEISALLNRVIPDIANEILGNISLGDLLP